MKQRLCPRHALSYYRVPFILLSACHPPASPRQHQASDITYTASFVRLIVLRDIRDHGYTHTEIDGIDGARSIGTRDIENIFFLGGSSRSSFRTTLTNSVIIIDCARLNKEIYHLIDKKHHIQRLDLVSFSTSCPRSS